MDIFADFRILAAVAGLLVLVAVGIVVARRLRPPAPPPPADSAPEAGEAGYLDSSHIISGPVLRAVPPGAADGPTAGTADDDAPNRRGRDAAPRR